MWELYYKYYEVLGMYNSEKIIWRSAQSYGKFCWCYVEYLLNTLQKVEEKTNETKKRESELLTER